MIKEIKFLLALCFLVFHVSADGINGCNANSINAKVDGFVGNIYYYPWAGNNHEINYASDIDPAYQKSGYAANATIVTENDGHSLTEAATVIKDVRITNLTYNHLYYTQNVEVWMEHPNFYTTDGSNPVIPITNYVFSLNGFIIPKVSGEYTFSLQFTDDVSILSMGDGLAGFGCCSTSNENQSIDSSKAQIYKRYLAKGNSENTTITLTAGYAYPVSIWYANIDAVSAFSYVYTGPDGVTHEDWTGFAYSSYTWEQEETCSIINEQSTATWWTGSTTSYSTTETDSTYTTTIPATGTTPEIIRTIISKSIQYIEYDPRLITTTTTPWTGVGTTTTTTDGVTTGTDGTPTTSTTVIIKTPEHITTTTTPWTGVDTTSTTDVVTTTGTDGTPTTSTTVIIKTPEHITTTTTPWTGVDTTSTTDVVTTTGTDGTPTTSTTVIIKTPTFSGWNSSTVASSTTVETSTLPTTSIVEPSTSVTTATSTDVKTVVCTKSICESQSQESTSVNTPTQVTSSTIAPTQVTSSVNVPTQVTSSTNVPSFKTSYLTSSSNGHVPSSKPASSSPAIQTSLQISTVVPSHSIITTDNANKANSLVFSGLAVLLLQFI